MSALGSRKLTLALLATVVGVNSAYILRTGSPAAIALMGIILAAGATAAVMSLLMDEKERQRPTHQRRQRTYYVANAVLGFLGTASVLGVLG